MAAHNLTTRIRPMERLCPEQIVSSGDAVGLAALVDQWGRAFPLAQRTVVGRELEDTELSVFELSVSRRHAEVRLEGESWLVEDLDSTNGTFVDGQKLRKPTELRDHDLLTFGDVDFAFHSRAVEMCAKTPGRTIERTGANTREQDAGLILLGEMASGGVVEDRGTYVKLGTASYLLVQALAERMLTERSREAMVRGFVTSLEILELIPWETPYPEDNNVKQLIRRTRRAFMRAGLDDPIEGRHGAGYRLVHVPYLHRG